MAGAIVQYLQYGTPFPGELGTSQGKELSNIFLPSFVLLASDSPSLMPSLLCSVASEMATHRAFLYTSLDYVAIYHAVLKAEAEVAEKAGFRVDQHQDSEKMWRLPDEEEDVDTPDECWCFEEADEKERVKIAVLSLRKLASEFYAKISRDTEAQFSSNEGNIWSNEACLAELRCLLPIAVARCPALLSPEQLVKGLLAASSDCALLVATFINNPIFFEQGVVCLVEVLSSHSDIVDTLLRSSFSSLGTSKPISVRYQTAQQIKVSGVEKLGSPIGFCPKEVELAVWALIRFCQVAPAFAAICRDELLNACTFAEMALQITVEIFHDTLEFLSRAIFSREDTSKWMLSCVGAFLRASDRHHSPIYCPSLVTANISDLGVMGIDPITQTEGPVQRARESLLADARSTWQQQGWSGRLHSHLRLFCVLVRAGDMQPNHEEILFWLKAFASNLPEMAAESAGRDNVSILGERTLQLGISFVCLMPGLSNSATRMLFYSCVSTLLHGVKVATTEKFAPSIELSVWLAVQLLLRNLSDIAAMVREALGMHLTVHNSMMRDLVDAATGAGFLSEPSLVVEAVAALRPKGPITAKRKKLDMSLTCLEQLITMNQFSRHGVDPAGAIFHCISVAREPIHPALPQLVQVLADSSAARGRLSHPNQQLLAQNLAATISLMLSAKCGDGDHIYRKVLKFLDAAELKLSTAPHQVLPSDSERMPIMALAVFYILCIESNLRDFGLNFSTGNADTTALGFEAWWSSLLASLPLKPVLAYMEEHWLAYEHLLPKWLSVAFALFPEKFHVSDLFQNLDTEDESLEGIELGKDLTWIVATRQPVLPDKNSPDAVPGNSDTYVVPAAALGDSIWTLEHLTASLGNVLNEALPALHILQSLVNPSSCQAIMKATMLFGEWELEGVVVKTIGPLLLQPTCARCVQDHFCSWWRSLQPPASEHLVPVLLGAIKDGTVLSSVSEMSSVLLEQDKYRGGNDSQILTYSQLVQEPLASLACSVKVYRTPLLGILLTILQEVLVMNKRICQASASELRPNPAGGGGDHTLRREEIASALAAQDSLVCQTLLEACLPNKDVQDDRNPGPLLEARPLICAVISSLVHSSPSLLKLLHFQCYDPLLLPMMVDGVPAMVHCFDFLPDLLQHPQQQQQVFAVLLTAQLASRHPKLPHSLAAAQQVVAYCTHIRSKVAGSVGFLQQVLGAVADCATVFPSLVAEVVALLQGSAVLAGPIRPSGRPRDPALEAAAIQAFRKLLRKRILHGRPSFD